MQYKRSEGGIIISTSLAYFQQKYFDRQRKFKETDNEFLCLSGNKFHKASKVVEYLMDGYLTRTEINC